MKQIWASAKTVFVALLKLDLLYFRLLCSFLFKEYPETYSFRISYSDFFVILARSPSSTHSFSNSVFPLFFFGNSPKFVFRIFRWIWLEEFFIIWSKKSNTTVFPGITLNFPPIFPKIYPVVTLADLPKIPMVLPRKSPKW